MTEEYGAPRKPLLLLNVTPMEKEYWICRYTDEWPQISGGDNTFHQNAFRSFYQRKIGLVAKVTQTDLHLIIIDDVRDDRIDPRN